MKLRLGVGLAVLFATAIGAAPAEATVSAALSMRELVQGAEHVVVATALDEHARRDARGRIVTDFTIEVNDRMKGPARAGSRLTMTQLGGVIGDLGMRIEGEPHLDVGERYVLFLGPSHDRRTLRPVGMSQGVMPLRERNGETVVLPGGAGLSLVQRVQGGQLMPAPPALMSPEPWARVRARIVEIIGASGGRTVAP